MSGTHRLKYQKVMQWSNKKIQIMALMDKYGIYNLFTEPQRKQIIKAMGRHKAVPILSCECKTLC